MDKEFVRDDITFFEGRRNDVYLDSEGLKTVGIGHLIKETDHDLKNLPIGSVISDQRVDELFEWDFTLAVSDTLKLFPKLYDMPEAVQHILVNMMFNLGYTRFSKFRMMIAAVNAGQWDKAADEMVDSKWYKQVGRRSKALVARMRSV